MTRTGSTTDLPILSGIELPGLPTAAHAAQTGLVARVRRALAAGVAENDSSGGFAGPLDVAALDLRARRLAARGKEFAGIRLSESAARLAG